MTVLTVRLLHLSVLAEVQCRKKCPSEQFNKFSPEKEKIHPKKKRKILKLHNIESYPVSIDFVLQ